MKTRLPPERDVQGNVLLITLGIILILGLGLASVLALSRWQYAAIIRSHAWNAAMAMAEAGVEDALAQVNPSALLFTTNIDRGANGWALQADGMYHAPRRHMSDGYYDVALTADKFPTIYATGYVTIPALSATISRSVIASTTTGFLFRGAMVARNNIDLNGNDISTDSFDSNDPNYNTGGLYDPAKRKAGGDVASTEGLVNVQNADIMGTLYAGPDGGYTIGSGGSVGDVPWVLGGNHGLQSGHYKSDFNMDFPDVLAPYAIAVQPSGAKVEGINYVWVLGNNNYLIPAANGVKLQSGDHVLVTGRARLYVTGDFTMSGGSSITIASGASLELYVGGANGSITTLNNAGTCASFTYFGLPGNTSISLSGNAAFLGSIYAPNATFSLSGGGNNTLDFQGACAVRAVTMNGHFNFHFDENLKRSGPARGYQITSWRES